MERGVGQGCVIPWLDPASLHIVCNATVISRITYAAPSWWRLISVEDKQKLQSIVGRAKRWGFYNQNMPGLEEICTKRENDLFSRVLLNPSHLLQNLLPPLKNHSHNLRARAHDRQLPSRRVHSESFVQRMLFKNLY